ncbi:MAG: pyridoxal-phosphate dependent enzyme [Clostridia bacterium]|nr:pyridoxal-phosphate dependent enzyme [Clostridia bacterium]
MPTLQMIQEAAVTLRDIARLTPVLPFGRTDSRLFIKAENLQNTGSFKIRGAYNKLSSLTAAEAAKGVIACSAGNHAQGVAFSAMRLGMRAVICMPDYAPEMKVEGTRSYGAQVVLVPGNYDDSAREAARLSAEKGYTFAHPFNDPYVIAGQGTIALELLSQMPQVQQVLVPIGGGGLISGIAIAVKSLRPDVKVIGVQTLNVPSMYASIGFGEVETLRDKTTIADGIHVLTPGSLTFEIVEKYVDDIVTVREEEIEAAIAALLKGPKLVAEGAGATGIAAYMSDRIDTSLRTIAVVSGGNIDLSVLKRILEKNQ